MVGFTGSRNLHQNYNNLVAQVVAVYKGHRLAVGCANGADKAVRFAAFENGQGSKLYVYRANRYGPGPAASRLVKRSTAMVQAIAASQHQAILVAFTTTPCPTSLVPSNIPAQCFAGYGSGTWATLALAVGLGVTVLVYPCGSSLGPQSYRWGAWLKPNVPHLPTSSAFQLYPNTPYQKRLL